MATATATKRERETAKQEAADRLRSLLSPGDTVYGIVRTVSRSGMSRTIDFYTFKENRPLYLSGYFSTLLDYRQTPEGALKVPGCGMDMVSHVIYEAGRELWPAGFGAPCFADGHDPHRPQSAADSKGMRALNGCRFYGRNGDRSGWDSDGGYALRAETL